MQVLPDSCRHSQCTQVLQQFTSGGSSGGKSQTDLISFAMAEASSLFDQHGGGSQGSKQDAVNGAAMTVMKLLVQSKFGGGIMGGGNSGGLGSLMGLVSHNLGSKQPQTLAQSDTGVKVFVSILQMSRLKRKSRI